jgi:hypothetical protein
MNMSPTTCNRSERDNLRVPLFVRRGELCVALHEQPVQALSVDGRRYLGQKLISSNPL